MSGRPLVLLHGWGLTPRVWDTLREALPRGIVVHAPAMPGHAGAPPVADPTLEAWADALLPTLPDAALLCGWSIGGMIALDLARRHPQKVAQLILVGTSPRFVSCSDPDTWPHGLETATVEGFIGSFARDPAATLNRFVALQALGDSDRRGVAARLNAALADACRSGVDGLAAGLQLLATTDLRPSLSQVHQPVQLLHGARDALMPLAAAEWLAAQLPDARLMRFDACGHAPFLSRPAECAELIASFAA
ncbi:alpha/beta fold hydrolase [Aromatoleum sp.]|uniref:alpha/beta fold hydrolase n=1 Tax=Aromatoleum sp. TaxID=2307007 RepID=UPI002FCB880D